ncbi:MotE family protein [Paenibacillus dakarensis]|uniref:MotE family protein n=1 Tax=Paenibacillus dakarensis TaxID=1527293 RepID=UPI000AB5A3F7|nr:kinesin [Paenibacillus dakarensis]
MARNDMPIDQEESSGGVERILLFLIPIIFTIVLVGVLLTLFNINVRNGVLDIANKIPIVKNWVPDAELSPEQEKLKEVKKQEESSEATIKELKKQLAEKEKSLTELIAEKTAQDEKVMELQTQVKDMKNQAAAPKEPEEDPYAKQIKDLAKLYGDMSPSKAAPIMQNLALEEMVLMFSEMKSAKRIAILEKMDPKTAADATMMLKDAVPSDDLVVSALQARLKKNESSKTAVKTTDNLDKNQLSQTFSQMTPASAAELLLQTYKISQAKTITILNTVDDGTRARILNAMSTEDPELTAKILNRLMGSK